MTARRELRAVILLLTRGEHTVRRGVYRPSSGQFASRILEDGLHQRRVPGTPDRKFCGLVYLYSSLTGELLAIIHDGFLQKFRVAGTGAVGAKYLARKDAR